MLHDYYDNFKEEFYPHLQILSPHRSLSSLLKWQICLKSEETRSNSIVWKQEDQVQVAAICTGVFSMTGGLHMEINSGPFTKRRLQVRTFYATFS